MSKIVHNKMKKGRFCIVFLFLAIIFIPIFLGALNSIETKNLLLKFSVKKSDSEISKNNVEVIEEIKQEMLRLEK